MTLFVLRGLCHDKIPPRLNTTPFSIIVRNSGSFGVKNFFEDL